MEVIAMEMGEQSKISTNARRFAPQGARVLADVLERCQFADKGTVILDWSDELDLQPKDAIKPVIFVTVTKRLPEFDAKPWVKVEVRLDVEDLFGNDNITAENILATVGEMETKMGEAIAKRRNSVTQ